MKPTTAPNLATDEQATAFSSEQFSGEEFLEAPGRLSHHERGRRSDAVAFANASIGLEGMRVSDEARARAERFIGGEIDLAEFLRAV